MKIYNEQKLRLHKSIDYWWNIILGSLITLFIIIPLGFIIINKMNLDNFKLPYFIFNVILVAYYQWKDDNLTLIKTNYKRDENLIIIKKTLQKLNWNYRIEQNQIELTLNKYLLKFINPTIIIEDKRILFNFKYYSNSKTGKLPFFFGVSAFIEWKFKNTLSTYYKI